jgi:hypothetical protein
MQDDVLKGPQLVFHIIMITFVLQKSHVRFLSPKTMQTMPQFRVGALLGITQDA